MTLPELAVKQSGYGGRGYVLPPIGDQPFKMVTNDGKRIKARVDADGEKIILPSVTTVLKAAAQPGIVQWSVDQTAAFAAANVDSLLTRSETQAYNSLRWYHSRSPLPLDSGYDARNYYQGVLNDAAELGTVMHEWAQADVDERCTYPDVSLQPDLFWQMVPVWDEWFSQNFITPIYTELTVYNMTEGYAGTLDILWNMNGKLVLGDIKTSRSLWPDHSRQIAALANAEFAVARDENGEWVEFDWQEVMSRVESIGFLHIRPDDVTNEGMPIPAYCEWVEAENLDLNYKAFLGLLAVKHAEREIAQREKEQSKSV